MLMAGLQGAPASPYNVPIGPHRRFAWVDGDLAQFKAIKSALGGTVNDIVLSVVAGALRSHMEANGHAGRRHRAEGDGADVGARRGRARRAGQPRDRHVRAAAGPRRRPGRALRGRPRGDEGAQGVRPGRRRRGDHPARGLRAADGALPGLAAAVLPAHVQRRRDERARAPSSRSSSSGGACCASTRRSRWSPTPRWGSRSCPTTARSTSGCSATTTRCRTSTTSPPRCATRSPSSRPRPASRPPTGARRAPGRDRPLVRRALGWLIAVVLGLAAVGGGVLLLQSRDDAGVEKAAGPGERVEARCPGEAAAIAHDKRALSDDQLAHALALGNVVLRYRGTRPPRALRAAPGGAHRPVRRRDRRGRAGGDPRARSRLRRRGARVGPAAALQLRAGRPAARVHRGVAGRGLPGALRLR